MNRQQFGVTLIELLISMGLSLVLIAGIGSLFVQMQKSGRVQRAVSNMMDDSRYVQEILQKEIRRTGGLRSRSDNNGRADQVFLGVADFTENLGTTMIFNPPVAPNGEYIKGSGVLNDEFLIRYQLVDKYDLSSTDPANSSSPCTSNLLLNEGEDPSTSVHVVTIYFYLSGDKLTCRSERQWIDPLAPGVLTGVFGKVQAATELVSNVQKMNITYGVDSDADSAADYYTDAINVPAANWDDVVSLRLTLLLRSEEENLVPITSYTIDDTSFTPDDHKLYRVFSTTIALRNQLN